MFNYKQLDILLEEICKWLTDKMGLSAYPAQVSSYSFVNETQAA